MLGKRGAYAEAEELLRECLAIRRKSLPPTHWHTAETRSVLGETLAALGRYPEAERQLLEAHPHLVAALGPTHRLTVRSLGRIADLYERWGKEDLAARYRSEAGAAGSAASPLE